MIGLQDHANTRHGGARRSGRAPEYVVWHKMLRRCRDPLDKSWENYGGRGINVCDRWQDFGSFYADMGPRPTPQHTLERVNNDGGYGPANCRWATRKEQAANRRPRVQMEACRRGHALTGDNLYLRPDGKRGCKACRKSNMRAFYQRHGERQP